jgi:hypothetical protein
MSLDHRNGRVAVAGSSLLALGTPITTTDQHTLLNSPRALLPLAVCTTDAAERTGMRFETF